MLGLVGNSHQGKLCCLSWGLPDQVMLRAEVAPVTPSALSFVSPNKVQGETLRALSACAGGS